MARMVGGRDEEEPQERASLNSNFVRNPRDQWRLRTWCHDEDGQGGNTTEGAGNPDGEGGASSATSGT